MKQTADQQCDSQPPEPRVDEHMLTLGWQAARRGEPYDKTALPHWQMGWRLWHHANPRSMLRH
jgi:predicted nucleic acid-binding Zn ribbon protein